MNLQKFTCQRWVVLANVPVPTTKHQMTICSLSTPTNTHFWMIVSLFILNYIFIIQIIGFVIILNRSVALCVIVYFFTVHNVKDSRLNDLCKF